MEALSFRSNEGKTRAISQGGEEIFTAKMFF
jgi:hypothetical protein